MSYSVLGPGDFCSDLSLLHFLPCQFSRTHWHGNSWTALSLEDRLALAFPALALPAYKIPLCACWGSDFIRASPDGWADSHLVWVAITVPGAFGGALGGKATEWGISFPLL